VDRNTWRRRLCTTRPAPPEPDRSAWVGVRPVGSTEVLVAAPFLGTCTADDLHLVADLIEAHHVVARPTTERSVALSGGPAGAAAACRVALRRVGWIVDADDQRASLSACIGQRGCGASLADTEGAARRLVVAGVSERTHLSGCAKACGAPSGARHLVATGPCSFEVVS
jgi:precorrin-3B synthase